MNHEIFFSLYNLSHQSPFMDWLIHFLASPFGIIITIIAGIFLFFHVDGKFDYKKPSSQLINKIKELSIFFSSGVFAWLVATLIKSLIESPRPFIFFQDLQPLFIHGGMDSFPSGHASFFMAIAVLLFQSHRKIGFVYIIFVLIIGMARIASGIHFPVDILVGYIIGVIVSLIFGLIFKTKRV